MCPSASHQVASRRACLLKICLQNLEETKLGEDPVSGLPEAAETYSRLDHRRCCELVTIKSCTRRLGRLLRQQRAEWRGAYCPSLSDFCLDRYTKSACMACAPGFSTKPRCVRFFCICVRGLGTRPRCFRGELPQPHRLPAFYKSCVFQASLKPSLAKREVHSSSFKVSCLWCVTV